MADTTDHKRTQTVLGVTTIVNVFRCSYCGHSVTGSTPNYSEEFSTPNRGGAFVCRARGGVLPHATF